ncbi:hypothetical protein BS78_10G226800 [Paspalum vaginatum]|nr:hypothetical protein BS78_10G226800 [Paspalum vaginatum]
MEAPPQKHGSCGEPPAAGAGGDDDLGFLRLLELRDRRLRAAAFFLTLGSSVVIYSTVLNRLANPKHILVGFVLFFVGAALALLTLGGAAAGRVAGLVEEVLRGFF